jgi:hypothetical protein
MPWLHHEDDDYDVELTPAQFFAILGFPFLLLGMVFLFCLLFQESVDHETEVLKTVLTTVSLSLSLISFIIAIVCCVIQKCTNEAPPIPPAIQPVVQHIAQPVAHVAIEVDVNFESVPPVWSPRVV